MKKLIAILVGLFLTQHAFSVEVSKYIPLDQRLERAYIAIDQGSAYDDINNSENTDNFGLIYSSNQLEGELVIETESYADIRIPIKMTFHGLGATAFLRLVDYNAEIAVKGLTNNKISDVFTHQFIGIGAGLNIGLGAAIGGALTLGKAGIPDGAKVHAAGNLKGIFLRDFSLPSGVGLELQAMKIDISVRETAYYSEIQYNRVKDKVLK
jgi:hypothetical protein